MARASSYYFRQEQLYRKQSSILNEPYFPFPQRIAVGDTIQFVVSEATGEIGMLVLTGSLQVSDISASIKTEEPSTELTPKRIAEQEDKDLQAEKQAKVAEEESGEEEKHKHKHKKSSTSKSMKLSDEEVKLELNLDPQVIEKPPKKHKHAHSHSSSSSSKSKDKTPS